MIHVDNITCAAGNFRLGDVTLLVTKGRYAVLMGGTGCGKTTLLEVICGLRPVHSGRVYINDVDVTDAPPGERGIGYVPQDGAMFPTYRVRDQIGFALRVRRETADATAMRVDELAAQLGIKHLLDRLPVGLSGGERQRVALGRALAARPSVLLLDEPLSALDEDKRGEIIDLLKRTQREHQLSVLHVTHSTREAELLADIRFRMEKGVVSELKHD